MTHLEMLNSQLTEQENSGLTIINAYSVEKLKLREHIQSHTQDEDIEIWTQQTTDNFTCLGFPEISFVKHRCEPQH